MSIAVNNISKRYGEQLAVDNISFAISSGEIVGFIGPNGAGKSTTLKIICGVIPPTSGEVRVNNLSNHEDPLAVKKIIGYLPEHNPLYYDMYIKEYLRYAAGLYGIIGKAASKRIDEIINMTGLSMEKYKKIGNLSKGYKQRVGLGQALIHDPEVLILDEPTSGLDPNQIIEIRTLISNVGKEKTILLSTHIMQEVEAICDRVIIIDKGKIMVDDKAGKSGIQRSNRQTIEVELENPFHPEKWKELKGISDVIELPGNIYLLATERTEDIRSSIFNFAVENKLTVLSMNQKEKNLEEVFKEVTSQK